MVIDLTTQEFQLMQSLTNEMFQTDMLRSGPMGSMIINLRSKFLVYQSVTLTDQEKGFLLFVLDDIFTTSHSSIVKSQLGLTMTFLRPTVKPKTVSQINQDPADLSGTYDTEWAVLKSIQTKLGKAAPTPYVPLKQGPDGDPFGISTPMHHDINDGTGYNNR